ncbi:MAG: hypothetical protein LBR91_01220 [Puniceicoccales bacterium]|nr:hypothetical protein [Puniceicoccales bacterium]
MMNQTTPPTQVAPQRLAVNSSQQLTDPDEVSTSPEIIDFPAIDQVDTREPSHELPLVPSKSVEDRLSELWRRVTALESERVAERRGADRTNRHARRSASRSYGIGSYSVMLNKIGRKSSMARVNNGDDGVSYAVLVQMKNRYTEDDVSEFRKAADLKDGEKFNETHAQKLANHFGRPILIIDYRWNVVNSYALYIPLADGPILIDKDNVAVDGLSEVFSVWFANYTQSNDVDSISDVQTKINDIGKFLPLNFDIKNATILQVLLAFGKNLESIVIPHTIANTISGSNDRFLATFSKPEIGSLERTLTRSLTTPISVRAEQPPADVAKQPPSRRPRPGPDRSQIHKDPPPVVHPQIESIEQRLTPIRIKSGMPISFGMPLQSPLSEETPKLPTPKAPRTKESFGKTMMNIFGRK